MPCVHFKHLIIFAYEEVNFTPMPSVRWKGATKRCPHLVYKCCRSPALLPFGLSPIFNDFKQIVNMHFPMVTARLKYSSRFEKELREHLGVMKQRLSPVTARDDIAKRLPKVQGTRSANN